MDGHAVLESGSTGIFPSECCPFTRMMELCGPVHASQVHPDWLVHWFATALPPPAGTWKLCLHHLAGAFSVIMEIHLGATCKSWGCLVKKKITQNKLDDLKRVIKICPFLYIPKGTSAPILRDAPSSLVCMESLEDELAMPLDTSCHRSRGRH